MIQTLLRLIAVCTLLTFITRPAQAQQTLFQGFEGSDNWSFTAFPPAYNNTANEDAWADTTVTPQVAPASGNRFWYMRDLDNPSSGGAFFHTLDFGPVDISGFSSNTLTFKYYTVAYDGDDTLAYEVQYDNGTGWDNAALIKLAGNTQTWETVTVNVPAGAQFIRLRLAAFQNGGSDYAGFDDVQLFSANGDVVAPGVTSASATGPTGIRLVFSEGMNATAEDVAHYSGVPGLVSALRNASGDTVSLSFDTPFVNGSPYTLTVDAVEDAAGNPLAAPFVYNFVFNNSTPNLVITEINYNPPSSDPDTLEFIEIYNHGAQPADIGGLQFGGVVSMFLPSLSLQAGDVLLIAANKTACETFFAGQTFYQWNAGSVLTNGGNTLFIRNSAGVLIDSVQYDDASPWPLEPDGQGPSAELSSPGLNNNDGANWRASQTLTSVAGILASPGIVPVDSLATISFQTASTLVQENAGAIAIPLTIKNQNTPLAEARVRVVSVSTAIAGEDYILADTVVTFLQGVSDPVLLHIDILDDAAPRNSRYLILKLEDFTAAAPGAAFEHSILINDDDTGVPQAPSDSPVSLKFLGDYAVNPDSTDATAEISGYDPASKRLFTTNINEGRLEIIDFKNPNSLAKIQSIDITAYGGGINSVAVRNGIVAVAVGAEPKTDPGKVVFFDTDGTFISEVGVGALPDHLSFSHDGLTLLVANEGEPSDDYTVDPEGSVSIIDLSGGVAGISAANVKTAGFAAYNADSTALRAAGIRIYGPNATVAQDFEPEYITVSKDNKTAWVTLQENNALAVIDLQTDSVTAILPLGTKDWQAGNLSLDVSDQTPGVFFNSWPVKGMYLPDAIASWTDGSNEYLLTANEGDVREWGGYAEIVRINSASYVLDSAAFPDAAYLKRGELLGRLNVTAAGGDTDGDGDFDEIYAFGGRSISIWNATTGAQVWDSGDDLERITAADPVYGALFNASNSNNTFKNRSDDKGPEPEGVAIGTIEGRNYAFAVLERTGGVMMYDITDPAVPQFIQWINTRATGPDAGGDLGPEGVLFIPKDQSPNGRNLLVVSNEISGTVSVFQINIDKTKNGDYSLVKYAFDNNPAIGVYGDTIREGGISGLFYRDGSFRFVGDRGPNADALNHPLANGQTTLVFPFPGYAPKVWQVKPENGALTVEDFDFIKRPGASGASGLPLPPGQGNTGEVAWSDTLATVVPNDPWGLDSEGLTQDNEGNFWVCDEYGASIWKLDADFKVVNRYTPFPLETQDLPLDSLIGKRRANRGFEGITYTPNGKIFAILQSPTDNPNTTTGNNSRIHRLVELDPATGAMRTFVYVHDSVSGEIRSRDWKLGDLAAINNEEFLVIEHSERNGWNAKNIYKFSIAGATPVSGNDFGGQTLEQLADPAGLAAQGITPVQKELFLDLLELGWELQHDKPEGLAIVDDSTIAVINDNDFGIASPNADGKIVLTGKTTRLYVYGLPADKHVDYVSPYCDVALGDDYASCGTVDYFYEVATQGFVDAVWSDGSAQTFTQGDQPGTLTVVATNPAGCVARDTVVIGLNPFPVIDLGPDTTICAGQAINVTFDAGNPGSIYSWITGDSTQTITATQPGGYGVTVTNAFGCESASVVFISSALPPVVNLGPNQGLCTGQTLNLDAGNPAETILWSTGDTTQIIQISAAGNYTVTVTNATGCTSSDALLVSSLLTPNVNLGADLSLCEGQSATLQSGYPGATILWSTGETTPSIPVDSAGTYNVQVTFPNGCADTDSIQVVVNPAPTVDLGADSTICQGQSLTFDAGNAGATYAWSNGANTQSITVSATDLYEVTVTNTFGCSATTDVAVTVVVCPATHENALPQNVSVFPNPTSGVLNVRFGELPAKALGLSLVNTLGQVVIARQPVSDLSNTLDLTALPKGLYHLRLDDGETTATYRVVVQ